MTAGERIREIRKSAGLKQDEFGARIGLGRSAVSAIEKGVNPASKQTIMLIAREFGASEHWIETGEGSRSDGSIAAIVLELTGGQGLSESAYRIVRAYLDFSPAEREALLNFIETLTAEKKKPQPADPPQDDPQEG